MWNPYGPTTEFLGARSDMEGLQQGPHPFGPLFPFPSYSPKWSGIHHQLVTPPQTLLYIIPRTLGEEVLGHYFLPDVAGEGQISRLFRALVTPY